MNTYYFSVMFIPSADKHGQCDAKLLGFSSDPLLTMLQLQQLVADRNTEMPINAPCVVYKSTLLQPSQQEVERYIKNGHPFSGTCVEAIGVYNMTQVFFFDEQTQSDYNRMLMEYSTLPTMAVPSHQRTAWRKAFERDDGNLLRLLSDPGSVKSTSHKYGPRLR